MKKALVLVSIFGVFFLAAYFFTGFFAGKGGRGEQSMTPGTNSQIISCEPNQISRVSFVKGESINVFYRVDTLTKGTPPSAAFEQARWMLKLNQDVEANKTLMMRLASMICEIYPSQKLPTNTAFQPSPELPKMEVEYVTEQKPQRLVFEFANPTADKTLVAKIERDGADKLFVKLPLELASIVQMPPEKFLNYQLMANSLNSVMAASFFQKEKELFTLERLGSAWRVMKAGKALGDGGEKASQFINRYGSLRGIEILSSQISQDGCEKLGTSMRVQLSGLNGAPESLYFKIDEKTKSIEACSTLRRAKFKIHADFFKYYKADPHSLLAK